MQESTTLKFAEALVAGNVTEARNMLSKELQASMTSDDLECAFKEMYDYSDNSPIASETQLMNTMDDWPDKQANDLCWEYVAICGDDFSEAVSAVVTGEGNGKNVIRELEWGRP